MLKAMKAGISVPVVYLVDAECGRIYMEKLQGVSMRDFIFQNHLERNDMIQLGDAIGQAVARLHDANIIHGDLTTSNLFRNEDETLFLIDFGLSFTSHMLEDKAVDLYVLERAILSAHPNASSIVSLIQLFLTR